MTEHKFNAGFRLSLLDLVVLIIGGFSAWLFQNIDLQISFMILFVVGHFFYFCNVMRMSRVPELIWAVSFIGLFSTSHLFLFSYQYLVYIFSLMITLTLTWLEIKKPSYHGIFWQKINPNLKDWFEKTTM